MKKIITTIFCLLSIIPSALTAQSIHYVVSGKIGNLSAPAKAYLIRSEDRLTKVDSVIMKNGTFRFTGIAKAPENMAYLKISTSGNGNKGAGFISFYTDAKAISIISPDSVQNAKITGGKINRDEAELNTILKATKSEAGTDEEDMPTEKKSAYINFIRSHPNSIISIKALGNISGNYPDPEEFEPLLNSLSSEVRSTSKGLAYAERLAGIKKVSIGLMAPDFTMADTAGKPVSLHNFKGKYVLLDFWASWCPPCRAESPHLVDSYNTYKDKNFTILSVSLDGPGAKSKWIKALQDDRLTWTHISDLAYNNEVARLYSIKTIPYNFLIGPDGKIVAKSLRGEALKAKLKEILDN